MAYILARLQDNNCLSRMSVDNYEVESMVCGYQVYHNIWEAAVGQTLACQRETGNPHDPYAVLVMEGSTRRAFSFGVKCSYALQRELQAASFSLGPESLSSTFFTASLAASNGRRCHYLGDTESSRSK